MTKKTVKAIVVILILVALGAGAYWYFMIKPFQFPAETTTPTNGTTGFQPIGRTVPFNGNSASTTTQNNQNASQSQKPIVIPTLRELSATPVGGYGAMVTASTTAAEWIDRGRGNVYQASEDSLTIATLSNTLVPRMYESVWNKGLTAFIGSLLQDGDTAPSAVYAQLIAQATTTIPIASTVSKGTASSSPTSKTVSQSSNANTVGSLTPFELRGKNLPSTVVAYAASPDKTKLFMFAVEGGNGVGYVSSFDGNSVTKIFTTPLTQVNVDWPSANIIAITTKGSASYNGYLYFVNPKTGVWAKVLGPVTGLSAIVSHDGKYVLASLTGANDNTLTSIYSVSKKAGTDAGIRTMAEKCAWGNFYQDVVYCAVPSTPVSGTYPDDWYSGALSTVDKIWQVDAATGEVHLVSSLSQTTHLIDGFNLGSDAKDNYLFFMNKKDLSLWSLNLVQSH